MKHLFSTIAFALLLSTNHVTAFNGGDMMEQGHSNDKAQVDNKTGQTDATKKAQAEAAKNKRNAPVNPNGNTNDAQLMTEGADADRHGNRERVNSGQQQQQQEADPSRQEADTTTVDTTAATTEVTIATPNANAGKDDESKGFLSGNMKMWLIVAVALVVIIYFASRKKPVKSKRSAEPAEEEPNADKKLIAALRENVARLEADVEALRQQNTRLENELESLRSQQAASNNTQAKAQNDEPASKKPRSMELYANILNGLVFPADDLQTARDEYTVFVLNVSGNEGTFKVNDAANAQLYLISNFAYSVASAVEVKSKAMSAKAIVTVQPGRVRKTNSGWTIVKKAEVELK